MYKVNSSSHADRQFKKLPKDVQEKMASKISSLANHPHLPHIKKLAGSKRNDWRLTVGNFRILYEVNDLAKEILVFSMADRKEVYRF